MSDDKNFQVGRIEQLTTEPDRLKGGFVWTNDGRKKIGDKTISSIEAIVNHVMDSGNTMLDTKDRRIQELEAVLQKLLEPSPCDEDSFLNIVQCRYCSAMASDDEFYSDEMHKPDCDYLNAKQLLGDDDD